MARPTEDASLEGKTALITGASRGIGYSIARRLSQTGARLALVARGANALQVAARDLNATSFVTDVSDPAAVALLTMKFAHEIGSDTPDIIVNAAGAFQLASIAMTDTDVFDKMIATNLRAPFLLMRAFLPAMLARGSGHIVTIGSVAGRQAFPLNGAYSASKFGVRGLHEVLAAELRGSGVRATLVEPAATDTPLWDDVLSGGATGLPERGQMLSPDDVAEGVYFALTRPARVGVPNILMERS
jgi:NADP-dependent 3-hydroxy acid dehydrogenase YdfG